MSEGRREVTMLGRSAKASLVFLWLSALSGGALAHDGGWAQFHSAREQGWPRLCTGTDQGPPWNACRVGNPRQVVRKSLHPQAMQIDPDAFRSEMPAPADRQLRCRASDRRRIVIGVGE
jgi:hypothetical protein